MIDPLNPPKLVQMPYEVAQAAFAVLATLPYGRVRDLMARLDAETEAVVETPPMRPVNGNFATGHMAQSNGVMS